MTVKEWVAAIEAAFQVEDVSQLRVLADFPVQNAPETPYQPVSEAEIADLSAWQASCRSGVCQI